MILPTFAVLCAAWSARLAPAPPNLEDLAFLAGAWEAESEGEFMREVWDAPRGEAMVGHFSIRDEGRPVLYELLVIERDEENVVMRLRHFGRGLTPWASEAAGPLALPLLEAAEGRAVFEDPAREFPRQVVYALDGSELTVRLVPAPDSAREEITIKLHRVED